MLWASVLDFCLYLDINEHLIGHCCRTSIVDKLVRSYYCDFVWRTLLWYL